MSGSLTTSMERERMWRALVPATTRLAADVRYDVLARQFEITGGTIARAIMRAVAYADAAGTCLDHEVLTLAAAEERLLVGRARVPPSRFLVLAA